MKELATLLEQSGFKNVKTYIQSGNVVFQSANRPSGEIENLIADRYGFKPKVIVLDKSGFYAATKNNPYKEIEGKFVHFYFCSKRPNLDTEILQKMAAASEKYQLVDNVFYLHAPDGIGRSKLVARIESCLGVPATGRNLNTISKLADMLNDVEQNQS